MWCELYDSTAYFDLMLSDQIDAVKPPSKLLNLSMMKQHVRYYNFQNTFCDIEQCAGLPQPTIYERIKNAFKYTYLQVLCLFKDASVICIKDDKRLNL